MTKFTVMLVLAWILEYQKANKSNLRNGRNFRSKGCAKILVLDISEILSDWEEVLKQLYLHCDLCISMYNGITVM
jgi:hypothetical protein